MSEANGNDVLVKVENLKKYFPIHRGVMRRQVGAVQAVDGLTFDIYKGETLSAIGKTIHVFMDTREKKKVPLTDELRAKFEAAG